MAASAGDVDGALAQYAAENEMLRERVAELETCIPTQKACAGVWMQVSPSSAAL